MQRRLLFIIVPVFLLLVGVAGVLFLRSRNSQEAAPVVPAAAEDLVPESKLKLIASEQIISAIPSFDGEAVWYMTSDGKLLRSDLGTLERQSFMFPESVKSPVKVSWQVSGSDLLIEENSDGQVRSRYYDSAGKQFVVYPDQVRNPVILAGDAQVAYDWVYVPPKATEPKHELKVANLDQTGFRKIGDLYRPDYAIAASPVKQEVVLYASDGPLLLVNLDSGEFKTIAESDTYSGVKFSPDGSALLVSTVAEKGKESFRVYNLTDFSFLQLDLPGTLAGTIWNKDSLGLVYMSAQGVYETNLRDFSTAELYAFETDETIGAREMFFHPSRDALFIIDDFTGRLYFLDYSK